MSIFCPALVLAGAAVVAVAKYSQPSTGPKRILHTLRKMSFRCQIVVENCRPSCCGHTEITRIWMTANFFRASFCRCLVTKGLQCTTVRASFFRNGNIILWKVERQFARVSRDRHDCLPSAVRLNNTEGEKNEAVGMKNPRTVRSCSRRATSEAAVAAAAAAAHFH